MNIFTRLRYGKSSKPRYIRQRSQWLYKDKWYNTNDFITEYTKPYCSLDNTHIYTYNNDNGITYHAASFDDLLEHIINNPGLVINNLQDYTPYELHILKTLKHYNLLKTFKTLEVAKNKILKSAEDINELFK